LSVKPTPDSLDIEPKMFSYFSMGKRIFPASAQFVNDVLSRISLLIKEFQHPCHTYNVGDLTRH
jgi:hypothetical protein